MKIILFDGFIIEHNEKLMMHEWVPKQSLTLLEVFLIRYGSTVTSNELMDMFWPDSDNPLSALKFAIHRLRKILNDIPALHGINLIHTSRGGYRFEFDEHCIVDCQTLEKCYEDWKIKKEVDLENLEELERANSMYQGSLFNVSDNIFITQKSSYYRNTYLEITDALCMYYEKHGLNEKLKSVALKAATLEPSVENSHFYYLQALINTQAYLEAFEYYQMVYKMLMKDYEMSLSGKMINLYDCIVQNKDKKANLVGVMDYYDHKIIDDGAFYCDNAVFDYIYEINMRNADRTQREYYVLMLEIKTDETEKRLESLQKKLKDTLQISLRKGDVFTKLNKYQFLVLLPCPDEKMVFTITQRIVRTFKKKAQRKEDGLNYYVRAVNTKIENMILNERQKG